MTSRRCRLIAVVLPVFLGATLLRGQAPQADGLEGLRAADGLEATLFAEAPMVVKPIALDIDARGRIWVTEGHNYRNTIRPDYPVRAEGDRIVILEDTTGDGRADAQRVFYQGRDIDAALGITVLGDRVIVAAYEHVFLLIDTDGDDRADEKRVIYQRDPHDHDHGVHSFVFGPDGRLYFNTGNVGGPFRDAAGNVIVDRAGHAVVPDSGAYRQGMVFRVRPDWTDFEVVGHNFRNPFEVALDSYGTMWQSDNDDDGNRGVRINYVMEYGNFGYQSELTGEGWRTPRVGMASAIPLRHWHQNDPGVVPNLLQTGAGSPTGLTVYEGELLPQPFRDAMIHADAGPRIVRAYPAEPSGAGYSAGMVNILRSESDPLFRPADVAIAPDGSLFVTDWNDPVVGGHAARNFTGGRIIRVAPEGSAYRVTPPDLTTAAGAVEALRSPSPGTRYLGFTRLAGLGRAAEPALADLWADPNPRMRARALWLLARLDPRYIDQAVRDADPDIRITGLRAARLIEHDVLGYAERLAEDPSPQVRREVAIALRYESGPRAAAIWTTLALQHDGNDRWYLEALGIAGDGKWDTFLRGWLERVGEAWNDAAGRDIIWRARTEIALPFLARLIQETTPLAQRERYFRALDFYDGPARERTLVQIVERTAGSAAPTAALALLSLDTASVEVTPELRAAVERTLDATQGSQAFVDLAGTFDARDRAPELVRLALAYPDSTIGIEAARLVAEWQGIDAFRDAATGPDPVAARAGITALSAIGGAEAQAVIEEIAVGDRYPLSLREAAVLAFARLPRGRGERVEGAPALGDRRLLELVELGMLPPELEDAAATVLFGSPRRDVRNGATRLLTPPVATTADGKPVPPAEELAAHTGDVARGQVAFERTCASCHEVNGAGVDFGPGLSDIGSKLPRSALYTAILEPDAGIAFNYEGSTVRTNDGREITGIIISNTPAELVLKTVGGLTTRYSKADIDLVLPLETSLMPAGLEETLTLQELIDLVEYLTTLRAPAP